MKDIEARLAERFWRHVDQSAGEGACWPWTGGKTSFGYGQFCADGKRCRAHRFSWELANDRRIPKGLHVCHSCDNPICVNPSHLWVGTASDNQRDAMRKGRAKALISGSPWKGRCPRKSHCQRGHELTPDNTYVHPGTKQRSCQKCRLAAGKQYRRSRGSSQQVFLRRDADKEIFDRLTALAEQLEMSRAEAARQCIRYALDHMES